MDWTEKLARDENRVVFSDLFNEHYQVLCLYAKRFVQDQGTREDIVQSVFVSLWEGRHKLKIKTSVWAYLTASVRNACLNHITRNNKIKYGDASIEESCPIYADPSEEVFTLDQLEEMLHEALKKLPAVYQQVFKMSRSGEYKNTDIADSLNVSERTVERYKKKTITLLKKELGGYFCLWMMLGG